ncbi:PSD1 and planctomycete cytochrome C domain-containing protein [Pedosphaera parvula]|nr:PSD1 and planctomycete cytochrome C domain-containing protein [Pedosphaera parvula]
MKAFVSEKVNLGRLSCVTAATAMLLMAGVARGAEKPKVVEIPVRAIDAKEAAKVSYTRDIKPILDASCSECHSSDEQKGQFDASTVASLIKGGKKAHPAIIPGKPDESAMVQYLRGQKEPQMPKGNSKLSADELHLIREWIAAGAVDDTGQAGLASKSPAASSKKANTAASLNVGDPAMQKALNVLMFSDDNKARLIAQRAVRTAYLPKVPVPPKTSGPTLNVIDQFIVGKWEQAGLKEARNAPEVCSDTTFLRRIYLDLIGVIPTVEEAQRFLNDKSKDKRVKLVDELLARKEDYAAHWVPFWEDALGSANVDKQGGIPTHGNYRNWIYQSFVENKPYDVMVAELIDPLMPGYQKPFISEANGKRTVAAYIQNETHTLTIQSAANVGQVFLGTGMKCASCHNHFLNKEWPQARFLAFGGMFATNDLESIRCEKHSGQFVTAKFPFELPDVPEEMPKEYEPRLHRVTQLLVDPTNPRFARTMVNRLWKRYVGIGLFAPADDYRLDQPPSHPELLDYLADDFIRSGYDLKHTIRLILTSRTYQLKYDPALEDHFDVAKPTEARYFRSPSLRKLTAEELIDSIRLATAQKLDPKKRLYLNNASTALTRALAKPASRNEISTSRSEDVAVVQALELLNGEEFYQAIYSGPVLDEAAREKEVSKAVDRLYWAALNRTASSKERQVTEKLLGANAVGVGPAKTESSEQVWIDDELPRGARMDGTGGAKNAWKWVTKEQGPVFSGERSHTQGGKGEQRQHIAIGANPGLRVGATDVLFTYVYLDPKNPPKEIMLQWSQGGWEHRAYWGEDLIAFGTANSTTRHAMGALPKAGEWVRLEVPAQDVGISPAEEVDGWAFDQDGGKVYWDKAGVVKRAMNPNREPLGDVLWALFTSPEFQFIR